MDPFELLKQDHQKVAALFKEMNSASEQAKRRIFSEVKSELDVHARIEETIFYPALEKDPKSRDITLESYEEHKLVKELLAELSSSGIPKDEWDAKLTVLQENVEHHVEEEEGELFDKAEDVLSDDELERLGDEMAAAKGQAVRGSSRKEPVATSSAKKGTKSGSSKQSKSNGESRGILGTLATLVGLGDSSSQKSGKKRTSRGSKSSSTRKASGATKKSAGKSASTKKAAKKSTSKTAASKRSRRSVTASGSTSKRRSRKGATARGTKKRSSAATKKSASKGRSGSRARSSR